MTDTLKRNAHLVESLGSALREGDHALGTVPDLLRRVLDDGSWKRFVTQRGERVDYKRFIDFVRTPPLKGIGATPELLYRVAPELTDDLDKAFGRKERSDKIGGNNNIVLDSAALAAPQGNSARRALRKLRKDAPELHAEVLAGNLTAHAAMVKAGYRPRTFTVRADSTESVAATLRRRLTSEQLAELARLLTGG